MLPDFFDIIKELTSGIPLLDLEERLKPKSENNKWSDASKEGFLAPHDEHFLDVVKRDYDVLQKMGFDYVEMAKLADDVLEQQRWESRASYSGLKGLLSRLSARYVNPTVDFDRKRFSMMEVLSLGQQSCPWGCEGQDKYGNNIYGGRFVIVLDKNQQIDEDLETNFQEFYNLSPFLVVTDLTPHLIASHYFFQGNTLYRTDPEKLVQFLRLDR